MFHSLAEAAAICSMDSLKREHGLKPGGNNFLNFKFDSPLHSISYYFLLKFKDSFMIVDCGGGTVDLTIRELTEDNKLIEITERTGDLCGSSYVDNEFIVFLGRHIGESAIDKVKENHYTNLQYLVQKFCASVKMPFTGKSEKFETFPIDLDEYKVIKQYIEDDEIKGGLERKEWLIEVGFDDVKRMFDPTIERIIQLVRGQLEQMGRLGKTISALLLVGGFSESKYLQSRIKDEFTAEVSNISVSTQPIVAIMKGGNFSLKIERNAFKTDLMIFIYFKTFSCKVWPFRGNREETRIKMDLW